MRRRTLPLLLLLPLLLPAAASAAGGASGTCRDPWITRAVREVTGRAPRGADDAGECDLRLYGARWDSYASLRAQVAVAFAALDAAALEHDAAGAALRDRRGGRAVPRAAVYVGPRRRAPARRVAVALAHDHVLTFDWPAADRSSAPPRDSGAASHPPQE